MSCSGAAHGILGANEGAAAEVFDAAAAAAWLRICVKFVKGHEHRMNGAITAPLSPTTDADRSLSRELTLSPLPESPIKLVCIKSMLLCSNTMLCCCCCCCAAAEQVADLSVISVELLRYTAKSVAEHTAACHAEHALLCLQLICLWLIQSVPQTAKMCHLISTISHICTFAAAASNQHHTPVCTCV